jgi:hypothetical protein
VSESIYILRSQPELKGEIVPIIGKWLRIPTSLEEAYDVHHEVFAFPPRVGRKGLQDVLEIIQRQPRRSKDDLKLSRFVDESALDELEKEGFSRRLRETSRVNNARCYCNERHFTKQYHDDCF